MNAGRAAPLAAGAWPGNGAPDDGKPDDGRGDATLGGATLDGAMLDGARPDSAPQDSPRSSAAYLESPPGWSATTPYGAPWPFDLAVLDEPLPLPGAESRPPDSMPESPRAEATRPERAARQSVAAPPDPLVALPQPDQVRIVPRLKPLMASPRLEPLMVAAPLEPLVEPPSPGRQPGTRRRTQPGTRRGRLAGTPYVVTGRSAADRLRRIPHRRLVGGGLAVAVILAVGAVVFVVGRPGGSVESRGAGSLAASAHALSFPGHVASYLRTRQATGHTLTGSDSLVSAALTAIYQRSGQPARPGGLLTRSVGVEVGHVRDISPASAIRRIYADFKRRLGRLADGQAHLGRGRYFSAGPLGGQVRCWSVSVPSATGPGRSTGAACMWADHDTFGFFFAPALPTSSLATTLLTFRSAIEMPSH